MAALGHPGLGRRLGRVRSSAPVAVLTAAAAGAVLVLAFAYHELADAPGRPARLSSPLAAGLGALKPAPSPVILAVAPVLSPPRDFPAYLELARYLEPRLGRRVDVVRRRTCAEVADLIVERRADAAVLCTGLFLRLEQQGKVVRVAAPRVGGAVAGRAYLIVAAASPVEDWHDLRGKSIALADPVPESGRAFVDWLLRGQGEGHTAERFFARTLVTWGHDASVYAVARGLVDAAAVDGVVWDRLEAVDPAVRGRTRVIARSPELGPTPLAARADIDRDIIADLGAALTGMERDAAGARVLRDLGVDGFVGDGEAPGYDADRRLLEATGP